MSLGTYNNSNAKKDYSPTTYSPVRFYNSESKVDPSCMSFSFWKQLLKISISPYNQNTSEGSYPSIDKDASIEIYLSPMKAKLFLSYLKNIRDTGKCEWNNVGVNTNKGIIYFTEGKEFGQNGQFIVIKIIDQESGNCMSSIAYEFNSNYSAIVNYNGGSDFNRDNTFAPSIEFDMFISVLENYVESVNYAIAATVVDNQKFDVSRITTRIMSIQDKLGIQQSGEGRSYGKSYFDNNNGQGGNSSDYNVGVDMNTSINGSSQQSSYYDELLSNI